MIQIKKIRDGLYSYDVFINGELFTDSGFFNDEEMAVDIDDYPFFDIQEIGDMQVQDFPDKFILKWSDDFAYSPLFDNYSLRRNENTITVMAAGCFNITTIIDEATFDWLLWNPYKLSAQLQHVLTDNGLRVFARDLDDFSVEMDIPAAGTIGSIFNKASADLNLMLRKAETNLRDLANERLGA